MKNYIEKQIEQKKKWAEKWIITMTVLCWVAMIFLFVFAFATKSDEWLDTKLIWYLIGIILLYAVFSIPALKKDYEIKKHRKQLKQMEGG